jgi:hypothetical protein
MMGPGSSDPTSPDRRPHPRDATDGGSRAVWGSVDQHRRTGYRPLPPPGHIPPRLHRAPFARSPGSIVPPVSWLWSLFWSHYSGSPWRPIEGRMGTAPRRRLSWNRGTWFGEEERPVPCSGRWPGEVYTPVSGRSFAIRISVYECRVVEVTWCCRERAAARTRRGPVHPQLRETLDGPEMW